MEEDDFVPNANSERKKIDLSAEKQDHYATMGLGGEQRKSFIVKQKRIFFFFFFFFFFF